jgi:hypothetical protein
LAGFGHSGRVARAVLSVPLAAASAAGELVVNLGLPQADVGWPGCGWRDTLKAAAEASEPRMKLPNAERALIDQRKLTAYSLDQDHDEGRHKASLLGITRENADLLIDAVQHAAKTGDAVVGKLDKYGQRYVIDFDLTGPVGTATIRTAWIIRSGEDFPRLITCFIL